MGKLRCVENEKLLNAFSEAVQETVLFTEQYFTAIVRGEADAERHEMLMHVAAEKRKVAKGAYLKHLEEHGCESPDGSAPKDRRKRADLASGHRRRSGDLT